MTYQVKTRNWNGNRAVEAALNIVAKITGADYWPEADHDTKYYLTTRSAWKAWFAWSAWTLLKRLSGGWTYILVGGAMVDCNYKTIYREVTQ